MHAKAHQNQGRLVQATPHRQPVTKSTDRMHTPSPGPLTPSAIVSLQRYLGNSGVQRLLEAGVQRKKVIDEDVRINGDLSVQGHVFGYGDVFGKTSVMTDGEVVGKAIRSDGAAEIGGDLVVRGNTRKGRAIEE